MYKTSGLQQVPLRMKKHAHNVAMG